MAQQLRLVLFGPPGAGKGSQAQLLTEQLQVPHISSGDLFRRRLEERTVLGLRAAEFMNQGLLVPDEVTIDIILEKVLSIAAKNGFVLDGFPRNPNQAEALEEALARRSRGLDNVVHLDVPESELVRRLGERFICRQCQSPHNIHLSPDERGSEGTSGEKGPRCRQCGGELYQRTDDNPEAVRRRIVVYRNETLPVLDFYRERGLLLAVPACGSIECVGRRVLAALGQV